MTARIALAWVYLNKNQGISGVDSDPVLFVLISDHECIRFYEYGVVAPDMLVSC